MHFYFYLFLQTLYRVVGWGAIDPTKGFISQHLNESNLVIQRPYDVPENQRYSFNNGFIDSKGWPIDPTHGFIDLPFNESLYNIQKPFNLPIDHRYSFINGVHKLWVYSTDSPLSPNSPTKPRTEISINGYNYSSGAWQFEANGYVPCGTSGVCIMQVFGSDPPHATTLMLRVYSGMLSYYRAPVIVPNIYDKWFNKVKVYIDGVLRYEGSGRGGASHHFKCGVYAQNDDSYYMESRWKKIRVLKKCD
ncbi:hypothetical protein CDL12_00390 [Handroanthus impetiginosus]|uniref:Alginate lyase 2 domain-containing protein n=1 Tax=Handroanthus impetiginosus TaxID=429701 RepID=A0A2G9IAR4_9LAMI|nr:hypothetical protein CDL12_00390 [Handroanthus impetiginosus]